MGRPPVPCPQEGTSRTREFHITDSYRWEMGLPWGALICYFFDGQEIILDYGVANARLWDGDGRRGENAQ